MNIYEVKGQEPSFLPEGKFRLVWKEEFDGEEIDPKKWDYRLAMMGKKWPSWDDKSVTLDGKSKACFTLRQEGEKVVCSQLQTGYNFMDEPAPVIEPEKRCLQWPIGELHESLFTHSYGYYECFCRMQQKEGWWSAFWLQSPVIGCSLDPNESGVEIDIMECFTPGKIVGHNVITGGYGKNSRTESVGGMSLDPEAFHRFGLLWDETGYTFYVDGREDGKITGLKSNHPAFLMLSTEARGYRLPEHRPTKEAYSAVGDSFLVDYVRVFDRVDE